MMPDDDMKDLTPGQRVRTHILTARLLLDEIDKKVGRLTADQIIGGAQVHALLAIATALGDPDVRR